MDFINKIAHLYCGGEYRQANEILANNPILKGMMVEWVELYYGWAKPFMLEIPNWGSPFDWVFGSKMDCSNKGLTTLGAIPPLVKTLNCSGNNLNNLDTVKMK